jgi:hypothetical protein
MISLRNAGYVIGVDDFVVTLFEATRRTFHTVERGPGTHFWVDDSIPGNHRFTSFPEVNDVIHFVTSGSITDEADATKIIGDLGESVTEALVDLVEDKAPVPKKRRGRPKKKAAPVRRALRSCLMCGNDLTEDDLAEYCSVCASIHEIED